MIADYLIIALKNLNNRKLRTALTIIGIIIGVSSIIALISISQGLQNAIVQQFEEIGTDKIFIAPKHFGPAFGNVQQGLTTDDADVLEKMPEFDFVTQYLMVSGNVEFGNEKELLSHIMGYTTEQSQERMEGIGLRVAEGRYFRHGDSKVAIIGNDVVDDVFDKKVGLNNQLTIKDEKFRVIGILKSLGNSEDDSSVYLPLDDVRDLFDKPNEVAFIELNVKEGLDINQVAEKVERKLENARDNEEFEVLTPEQTLAIFENVLGIVQIVLGGIAAISIVVGAIGIMNSLYSNVLERTKEIGIMKAIGAKNVNILTLFLLEAGIIGFIGGVFGVILGFIISKLVGIIAANAGFGLLLIKVNPFLILFGLLFAMLVGMASGFFPALRASKLLPINALRAK